MLSIDMLKRYRKLGGPILAFVILRYADIFFCLFEFLGTITMSSFMALMTYSTTATVYTTGFIIANTIIIALLVAMVYFTHVRKYEKLVIVTFVRFACGILYALFTSHMVSLLPFSATDIENTQSTIPVAIFFSLIVCTFWLFYFTRSKRVKVYFASEDEYQKMIKDTSDAQIQNIDSQM